MLLVKFIFSKPQIKPFQYKVMLIKDKVLKGRYRVIRQLGQEKSGAVYEAYDSIRKANVALKEILVDSEKVPAITERENLKRAFADRAKILAEVKHESLPQVRGYFSEFERQYLVLELIDGDDTAVLLTKNEKPIPFADAANWADQLLDALDYLHTLPTPIIHGDVKPQNIRLTSRGRIKLLGFDITESPDKKVKTIFSSQPSIAELSYLPLEQLLRTANPASDADKRTFGAKLLTALKQNLDARSDVYALGATLYHLMTAQLAVDALERSLGVWAGEFDSLPKANELNQAIPIEVSDVLAKAMEVESEKRFGSAMEMRQALQTAVARAKERTAENAKKQQDAAAREVLMAEEKRLEQQRQLVEQERLKLEAEQKEQKVLIEKQLKAAETERLKAEQRAAQAEKRLLEEESKTSVKDFSDASNLFSEPANDKKSSWVMPAVIVFFLLVGGAGAGFWIFKPLNKVETMQTTTLPANTPAENPAAQPTIEAKQQPPPPTAEKISTTIPTTAAPTITAPTAPKNKPAAPNAAPRVEKPAAPKPAAPQKKAVTVDDIIGGN